MRNRMMIRACEQRVGRRYSRLKKQSWLMCFATTGLLGKFLHNKVTGKYADAVRKWKGVVA